MAPPKTPRDVREKLNKAIVAAMRTPEVQEKLKSIFVDTSDLDVDAMGRLHQVRGQALGRRHPRRQDHRRAVGYCAASFTGVAGSPLPPSASWPLVSIDGCGMVMML